MWPDRVSAATEQEKLVSEVPDGSNSSSRGGGWLEDLIEKGKLSISDNISFRDHLEVARLFGYNYKGHQSATISLDDVSDIWFPKMYPNGDWDNSLSTDGQVITMRHVPGGQYGGVMTSEFVRRYVITFGHVKPPSGPRCYRFLGVFEGAPQLSDTSKWVHQRVSDHVTFDGAGNFTFEPTRTRPVLDDQSAEAADINPGLATRYSEELRAGNYAVEDQVGPSKSRGSAQAAFAKAVKQNYRGECAVTGIRTPEFLVASHIVPWSEDVEIRLDPSNGICLSTFADRAFDAGFLTITPEGRTQVRWEKVGEDSLLRSELKRIDDVELAVPVACPPDPAKLSRRIELGY
jgi:hypothetical protein